MSFQKQIYEIERLNAIIDSFHKKHVPPIISEFENVLKSIRWKTEEDEWHITDLNDHIKKIKEYYADSCLMQKKFNIYINEAKKHSNITSIPAQEFKNMCKLYHDLKNKYFWLHTEIMSEAEDIWKFHNYTKKDTSVLKKMDELIIPYNRNYKIQKKLIIKIHDLLNSNEIIITALGKKARGKSFLSSFKRAKKVFKGKIGETMIYLEVKSYVDISKESFKIKDALSSETPKPIHTYIIEKCDEILAGDYSNEQKKWAAAIKNKKPTQIEQDLTEIVFNTLLDIIMKNQKLIRASRINIYAKFNPISVWAGSYDTTRSSFDLCFLSITLNKEHVESYLSHQKKLSYNKKSYDVIVHELSHAYDWQLNISRKMYNFAKEITGNKPEALIYELTRLLETARGEGFARISAFMNTRINNKTGFLVFSLDEYSPEAIKSNESVKKNILSTMKETYTDGTTDLTRSIMYGFGLYHDWGEYVSFTIMLSKILGSTNFWLCREDKMKEVLDQEFKAGNKDVQSIADKHNWKKIPLKELHEHIHNGSGLNFEINAAAYPKIQGAITAISLMRPAHFLKSYANACKKLGIDPEPVTQKTFRKMNRLKKEQAKALIKKEGF